MKTVATFAAAEYLTGVDPRKLTHDEISSRRLTPEALETAPRMPLAAILDNIRSLHNVGSMFRTADGARIRHLYLAGFTPHPPRKELEKTALGSTKTVPWSHFPKIGDAIAAARTDGFRIAVLEQTTTSIPYTSLTPDQLPICLVVGNEIAGVSQEAIREADIFLDIPMFGQKQSLNVSVAYGIALFELVRLAVTSEHHSRA